MAAIRAKEIDPDLRVSIFEKGDIRRSGSIVRGMDALNIVSLPNGSTPRQYLESLEISCDGIFDHKPSYLLAEKSFQILKRLEGWGIDFPKDGKGKYRCHQIHPRGKFLVEMNAPDLKSVLAKKVEDAEVKVLNRTPAIQLISHEGRILGAVGFNLRTGELVICSARAVILSSGGASRFGLPNTGYIYGTYDYPGNSGDGYSMAFHAGAELTGFEYTCSYPLIKDLNCPLLYITLTRGAEVIDADGNRLDQEGVPITDLVKHYFLHGGPLLIKMDHLKENQIKAIEDILFTVERPIQKKFFRKKEIDFRKSPIELHPTEFFLCGGHGLAGLVVDGNGKTNIDGLFAAGDVASVPKQHLSGAFVFGEVSAEAAINNLKEKITPLDLPDIVAEKEKIFALIQRNRGEIPVSLYEQRIRRAINDYVIPPKNEFKLNQAILLMKRFKKEILSRVRIMDYHELSKVFETMAIIDCARISSFASLARKESRWGFYHYRTDYPAKDNKNYLKHIIISKKEGSEDPKIKFRELEKSSA